MNKVIKGAAVGTAITKHQAQWWEIGNREANQAGKAIQKALVPALRAGAAFILAKRATEHGQWEDTAKASSTISLRTIQQFMQLAENALRNLGYEIDARSLQVIAQNPKKITKAHDRALLETTFAKQLLRDLNAAIKGKTQHQLEIEFGVRADRKPEALPPSGDDAQADLTQLAFDFVNSLEDHLAPIHELKSHMDEQAHQTAVKALKAALESITNLKWEGKA